jgi:hypothetical protein
MEDELLLTPEGLARSMCRHLQLTPPFTARVFADAVERCWDVQIMTEPCPDGEYTTGWCIVQDDAYIIYYYTGGSVVQRERILFHELCHITMGHLRGAQPAMVMRRESQRSTQEQVVEQVARALVAYAMFGESPVMRARLPQPISAYGSFIDSLLAR